MARSIQEELDELARLVTEDAQEENAFWQRVSERLAANNEMLEGIVGNLNAATESLRQARELLSGDRRGSLPHLQVLEGGGGDAS